MTKKRYHLEAEHFHRWNYDVVHGDHASGGRLVKLKDPQKSGDLWKTFDGDSGHYDVTIFVQDESDGQSKIMFKVGGELVEAFKLDDDDDGAGDDHGRFSKYVIKDVDIKHGEQIKLWVDGDDHGYEFVRIDKLSLEEVDKKAGGVVCIEAEDFHRYNYDIVHSAKASDGAFVKLKDPQKSGDLWTTFEGESSCYDVTIYVQDESDGQSTIMFKVGGELVEAFKLDDDDDGKGSDHGPFSKYVIKDVDIKHGEQIKLWVDGDDHGYEFVRIDKIELKEKDKDEGKSSISGRLFHDSDCDGTEFDARHKKEAGVDGAKVFLIDKDGAIVAETTTNHDGDYHFDKVVAGDYAVRFDRVDDKKFTLPDVGDKRFDSDVIKLVDGGAGQTTHFHIPNDFHATNIDAGLKGRGRDDDAPKPDNPGKIKDGTDGRDILVGTNKDDVLNGLGGDDKLFGRGGNDELNAGGGADKLYGGKGHDLLLGSGENDKLFGGRDDDTLRAGLGDDHLYGGKGDDRVDGGAGDDIMHGGLGMDLFIYGKASGGRDLVKDYSTFQGDQINIFGQGTFSIVKDKDDFQFFGAESQSKNADGTYNLVVNGSNGDEGKLTVTRNAANLDQVDEGLIVRIGDDTLLFEFV